VVEGGVVSVEALDSVVEVESVDAELDVSVGVAAVGPPGVAPAVTP